ncbi:hypothetical protein NN561_013022 [Cricetulus griseus]
MARLSLGALGGLKLTGDSTVPQRQPGLEDPLSGACDGGRGTGDGGGAHLKLRREAGRGGPRPGADAGRHCGPGSSRRFPPSAATAVPEKGGYAPGHPTSQSRHPAADGRRTHTPEVTQHSE